MARIRSTHPGQWTDEQFVMCSAFARLLCIALRNEADDNGVFEWKPATIKMRLLPMDAVDINDLLAELQEQNHVRKFEAEGKQYGAIRNFCKWQRPKKPNPIHPITPEVAEYVGLSAPTRPNSGEAVGNSSPTPSEKSPQMKEEGGKREEKEEEETDSPLRSESDAREGKASIDAEFAEWYAAYPHKVGRGAGLKAFKAARRKADLATLKAGLERYIRDKPPDRAWCNPATWLNGERWLDEPAAVANGGGGHGTGRGNQRVGPATAAINALLGTRYGETVEPEFLDAEYRVVHRQH